MNKYVKFYENVFTHKECADILENRIQASTLVDGNLSDLLSYKSDREVHWLIRSTV